MNAKKITIDTTNLRRMGATILSRKDVEDRKARLPEERWPTNAAYTPAGVSLEQARRAMAQC